MGRLAVIVGAVLLSLLLAEGVFGQAAKKKKEPSKGTQVKGEQPQPQQNLFPEDSHAKGFFAGLLAEGVPKSTDHIDPSIRNNVKLPFKMRFGVRERSSSKFHFPALPGVYWSHHKRPFVPVVEEQDDTDYDY